MKALLTLAVFGLGAIAAPIPKELKSPKDHQLIVGKWQQESLSVHGVLAKNNGNMLFEFTTDGKCGTSFNNVMNLNATYSIDQTETPRRMKWASGPNNDWQCVYELDGDKLLLGFVEPRTELPKTIEPAHNLTLYTFTRVK